MHPPFPAARVDRVIRSGEEIRLGNLALVPIATPGHTAGALSWHWGSCEGGVCRRIVYVDSLTTSQPRWLPVHAVTRPMSPPSALALSRLGSVECDVLLTPHPGASNMPDRLAGKAPLDD